MSTGTAGLAAKLIEGAGAATEGPSSDFWAMTPEQVNAMNKTTQQIVEAGGGLMMKMIQRKREKEAEEKAENLQEWDQLAQQTIEDGTYMSEEEYKTLAEELAAEREMFADASETDRAIMMNSMETRRDEIENLKNFRTTLSVSAQDQDGIRGNEDWLNSSEGVDYKGILSGDLQMVQEGGKYGYMMFDESRALHREQLLEDLNMELTMIEGQGGDTTEVLEQILQVEDDINKAGLDPDYDRVFKSVYDLEKVIKHQSFDREKNDDLMNLALNAQKMGNDVPEGREMAFNYDSTLGIIKRDIMTGGNIRSFINDKHLDESFKQNLINSLQGKDYEKDFNISPDIVKELDPNGGGVTKDDAKIIADALLRNQVDAQEYVARYFTNFLQQNYMNGYNSRNVAQQTGDGNSLYEIGDIL